MVAGGDEFNKEGHCFPGCLDFGVVLNLDLYYNSNHYVFYRSFKVA